PAPPPTPLAAVSASRSGVAVSGVLAYRSGRPPGSRVRQAVRDRGVCPLVRRGLRGHHFLRVVRAVFRDRRDRAVTLVRPRLLAGLRSLRHLPAPESGP